MFRTFLLAAVVVCLPALAAAQPSRDAVAKQIESMERSMMAALQKGDVAAFKANIADDGISVDGMGATPIAEFLKIFNQIKITAQSIEQPKVTFLNDSAAVITYRWTGKGTFMGQPLPEQTWSSTTWANRGGKWVAVFHQETPAAPPMTK